MPETRKNDFDALLATLAESGKVNMTKALPMENEQEEGYADPKEKEDGGASADGKRAVKKIKAAAKDGEEMSEGDGEMGKSFAVTLEDGTRVDAIDGTEMMKALGDDVAGIGDMLAKSMETITGVVKAQAETIERQGEMLKSLQAQLSAIGNAGAGRRVAVLVPPKLPGGGAANAATTEGKTTPNMLKSLAADAMHAGKITANEAVTIEAMVNNGRTLPDNVLIAIGAMAA